MWGEYSPMSSGGGIICNDSGPSIIFHHTPLTVDIWNKNRQRLYTVNIRLHQCSLLTAYSICRTSSTRWEAAWVTMASLSNACGHSVVVPLVGGHRDQRGVGVRNPGAGELAAPICGEGTGATEPDAGQKNHKRSNEPHAWMPKQRKGAAWNDTVDTRQKTVCITDRPQCNCLRLSKPRPMAGPHRPPAKKPHLSVTTETRQAKDEKKWFYVLGSTGKLPSGCSSDRSVSCTRVANFAVELLSFCVASR